MTSEHGPNDSPSPNQAPEAPPRSSSGSSWVWISGSFALADSARLGALHAGALVGWGVFSTGAIKQQSPQWSVLHWPRLRRDASRLDLQVPFPDGELDEALHELARRNAVEEGIFRVTVLGHGEGRWSPRGEPHVVLCALSAPAARSDGLQLWLAPHREDASRPLAGVKCTSYAGWQWMWQQALARGCDEAVYCESQGHLCEGSRSTLFWTRSGVLYTPSLATGCLPGLGRARILRLATDSGMRAVEVLASPPDLQHADEALICSIATSPRSVQSLILKDGERVDEWRWPAPGPITRRLRELWSAQPCSEPQK
jgi:branched-chain amino acid aminotransferase